MTSYSYQFAGEMSTRDEPFRHVEELPGPSGEQSFVSTNKDYSKHNYGRPHISYIPDTGQTCFLVLNDNSRLENLSQ